MMTDDEEEDGATKVSYAQSKVGVWFKNQN